MHERRARPRPVLEDPQACVTLTLLACVFSVDSSIGHLTGTNSLVNAITTIGAGNGDSRSTPSSKPVSAAAGIASLVPSKGAPVAAARPSLKPGEYPPTAELQVC